MGERVLRRGTHIHRSRAGQAQLGLERLVDDAMPRPRDDVCELYRLNTSVDDLLVSVWVALHRYNHASKAIVHPDIAETYETAHDGEDGAAVRGKSGPVGRYMYVVKLISAVVLVLRKHAMPRKRYTVERSVCSVIAIVGNGPGSLVDAVGDRRWGLSKSG